MRAFILMITLLAGCPTGDTDTGDTAVTYSQSTARSEVGWRLK
jgi:hypothetical protein